jgi:uncharacterized protein YecE (DUF72 family)
VTLYVGTASWTEPTLIKSGRFYPEDARSAEARLRYYADQFPVVEVDSSFYALPSFNNAVLWAQRTPAHFVFDVKLFRFFSLHQTPLKALPAELREQAEEFANASGNIYYRDLPPEFKDTLWHFFLEALGPLKAAGKLGYLLLQLPSWEFRNRRNLAHIEECTGRLDDYTLAVEFRNSSWLKAEDRGATLGFLRELNLPLVSVDEPQGFHSSMPLVWETTSPDLAVVRLHGHNNEMWMKKGLKSSAERFNYLYSEQELKEFIEPISSLARQTRQVHVMFNNCYEDHAQRNARQLMALLATPT